MIGPIIGLGEILWDMLPNGRRAGGAPFNFAFHCHQLGHPAVIVSRVGDDDLGRELLAEVHRLGMTDEFIQIDPEHPTGTVDVRVDEKGQPSYTITENVAWDFLEWRDEFDTLIGRSAAVSFGTLAQRDEVSRETIHRFLTFANGKAIRVCDINLRPPFVEREVIADSFRMADWVKMNDGESVEISAACGLAYAISRERPGELLCVTRGGNGCAVSWKGEKVDFPGIPIQVADTVGAGDAFTAGLVTRILEGKSLEQAARFANALAALVASRPGGTPTIDRAEVERLC